MKTIYKYKLNGQACHISMPVDRRILSCGIQNDSLVIWAEVETTHDTAPVHFMVFATGELISINTKSYQYLGTVTTETGLVFHIYCK
jgi:hypothetical protein